MQFHWQEILEIIKSHSMPQFSLNSFSYSGVAVPTMYPYLFLYPFILLFHLLKSVKSVTYLMLFMNTLIALLISYYSSLEISQKRVISYLFSLMYVISYYLFLNSIQVYALGMIYSFIFMPLVLFGFMYWIKNGKWLMLSIGMALIIYSSVIVSAFTPIVLLLWCLCNYNKLTKSKLINLIKAIIMTLFASSAFVIPAIKLMLTNKLNPMGGSWIKGANIVKSIISAFVPFVATMPTSFQFMMTIYSLLGIIVGIILFKKLSLISKQSLVLSLLIIIISSMIFPWRLISHTPLNTIQFPWRMYIIPQVLLTYILAWGVYKVMIYINNHSKINILQMVLILICVILYIQIANQSPLIEENKNFSVTNQTVFNTNMNTVDYYPKRSVKSFDKILKHRGQYVRNNRMKHVILNPLGNGTFDFNMCTNNNRKLEIPFLYYKDINYRCYLDGKYIRAKPSVKQLMEFKHVPKGNHQLKINVPTSKYIILTRVISLINLILYIVLILKRFDKRHSISSIK